MSSGIQRACAKWALALFVLLLAIVSFSVAANEDFLPVDKAFELNVQPQGDDIVLHWDIAPGYYLYRHRLELKGEPTDIAPPSLPEGTSISDEYFGDSEVYYDSLTVQVAPGQAEKIALSWQGCAEDGLCYAPQHDTLDLASMTLENGSFINQAGFSTSGNSTFTGISSSTSTNLPKENATTGVSGTALGEDQRLAARLTDANTGWMLVTFFGMGLLLVFTPCVLPMVPILSSLVVGSGASAKRGLLLSTTFVIPMALTYASLGVAAALAGANLQAMLQTPWVLGIFAAIFVALALAMFGIFELELPSALRQRLDRLQQRQQGGTLGGAAVMGVLSALLVGPCMTAPLAGALLYIADSGDALLGGSALLVLGLGMGAPLLLVGALGARLLPRPGPWMTRVKALFGFVLLGMAIWFLARVIPDHVAIGLWGIWLLGAAVALWQASVAEAPSPGQLISRMAGLTLGLWGAALIIGTAGGSSDPYRPLAFLTQSANPTADAVLMSRFSGVENLEDLNQKIAHASSNGQWTLVDVYADWCVSCKVIEDEVFGDPRVQARFEDMQLIRPDVTANDATDRALLEAYGILGPPTLMLFGPDGQEYRAQRVVGEISADDFLERIDQARQAHHANGGSS